MVPPHFLSGELLKKALSKLFLLSIKTINNGCQSYDQGLSSLACSRCEKEALATQFEKGYR